MDFRFSLKRLFATSLARITCILEDRIGSSRRLRSVGSSPRWRRSEKNSRFVSDPSCDPSRSAVRRSQGCRLETLQRARCGRCRASSRSWIGQGVRAGEGVQVDEVAAASPSGRPTARCARGRWWNGGAVLAYAQAHPGELASPPPPAQCAGVHARTVPLVHSAA